MGKADKGGSASETKKARKLKDANAPKKAVSAFMRWSQAERNAVKTAHPELDFGGIGKKMGELWASLPADEKQVRTQ